MADKQEAPEGISRIVFRQILDGDRLKFVAKSNLTDSGGGARDLRFRNWDKMKDTLGKIFPGRRKEVRKRGGVATTVEVFVGHFHWMQNGKTVIKEALLEPPTDARDGEGRITRVHEYSCFTIKAPAAGSGRMLAIFVQRSDGTVWPHLITEKSLEKDNWHPAVAGFLMDALNTNRRQGNAAYGYIDFTTGGRVVR